MMMNESVMREWDDDKNPRSRRSLVPMLVWSVATTTIGLLVVVTFV